MSTIVWTNSTEPRLEYKWSDAQDCTFWGPDPSAHTLTTEELSPYTHPEDVIRKLIDAEMLASFPLLCIPHTKAQAVPVQADTVQRIRDGLLAVVQQIEAEQKAAPVMNAIQATHNAFRSDGRPPLYVDPLRKGD